MPSPEITRYFDATESRTTRDDLVYAANIVGEPKVAIDCGCGAGADINYLVQHGFTVYAFDIEQESIARCQTRFKGIDRVHLFKASFAEFKYPRASLVVADASLFFCPDSEFDSVWSSISSCLLPNGIFCGSFLGNEDTMAQPGSNPAVFWSQVTAFEETEVMALLDDFEVLRFKTHKSAGKTSEGVPHNWHIFQVVAKKLANQNDRANRNRTIDFEAMER